MGLTLDLAASAQIAVVRIGSLELVAWSDMDALLRAAQNRKLAVLGLEGFKLGPSSVSPDMEAIADFSTLSRDSRRAKRSFAGAWRFLADISSKQLHFDIVWEEQK